MGTSTNALLFYGYAWEEENEKPWLNYDNWEGDWESYKKLDELDFEDYLKKHCAFEGSDNPMSEWDEIRRKEFGVGPDDHVPFEESTRENELWDAWYKEHKPRVQAFWKEEPEFVEELLDGITVGTHCSGSCPMYYIAIDESSATARRGYPLAFDNDELAETPERLAGWDAKLRAFCEMAGIEPPEKFQWFLASYWSS